MSSNEQKTVQEVNLPTLWSRIKAYVNSRIPNGSLAGKDIAPMSMGGTDATNAKDARVNLGITYGTEVPTDDPETGSGTIYFFEDEYTPMSIVEGGTGAKTQVEAVSNLGFMKDSGSVSIGVSGSTSTTKDIVFNKVFPAPPIVNVNFQGTPGYSAYQYGMLNVGVANVTTTGFTIRLWNATTDRTPAIMWNAIYIPE